MSSNHITHHKIRSPPILPQQYPPHISHIQTVIARWYRNNGRIPPTRRRTDFITRRMLTENHPSSPFLILKLSSMQVEAGCYVQIIDRYYKSIQR